MGPLISRFFTSDEGSLDLPPSATPAEFSVAIMAAEFHLPTCFFKQAWDSNPEGLNGAFLKIVQRKLTVKHVLLFGCHDTKYLVFLTSFPNEMTSL